MKLKLLLPAVLLSTVFFVSCTDDNEATSTVHLRLTDAPTALDSVFVDIQEVRVKHHSDTSESGWVSMDVNEGIYNLLELQNGTDTLLGTVTLPAGVLKEIRLILGTENRVVANGESFPLVIPSGAESGLKIKVDKDLDATLETITIDFDAAMSVRQEQNGYKLRPVIRVL